MATSTLLQIVQDMLNAIEAENVTTVVSGSTTEDALMCVNIANRTFEDLITRVKWKHLRTYKALTAGAYLNTLKAGTSDLYIDASNVYYGASDEEVRICYVDPETFVARTIARTVADSNVETINNIKVYNDRVPTFFTSFDDNTLVFDAMPDAGGLVASNSKALVYVEPTTRLSANSGVYSLPKQVYPHFRDLCIANAIVEIAGEETRGERLRIRATNQIAKMVTSGNLVDTPDNAWKNIITRNTSGRRPVVYIS